VDPSTSPQDLSLHQQKHKQEHNRIFDRTDLSWKIVENFFKTKSTYCAYSLVLHQLCFKARRPMNSASQDGHLMPKPRLTVVANAAGVSAARCMSAGATAARRVSFGWKSVAGGATAAVALGFGVTSVTMYAKEVKPDWNKVRKDISAILEEQGYDDGHIGPLLVRLAWHCSGSSPILHYSIRLCAWGSNERKSCKKELQTSCKAFCTIIDSTYQTYPKTQLTQQAKARDGT
jgi:hypothetical protein